MRKKENYVLSEIAGKYIIIPTGDEAIDFNGIISVNDTAKFLWESSPAQFTAELLTEKIKNEYDLDDATAAEAVNSYIEQMKEVGCIE